MAFLVLPQALDIILDFSAEMSLCFPALLPVSRWRSLDKLDWMWRCMGCPDLPVVPPQGPPPVAVATSHASATQQLSSWSCVEASHQKPE